jgi:hypothetical protein
MKFQEEEEEEEQEEEEEEETFRQIVGRERDLC